jgi:hypothetical protein
VLFDAECPKKVLGKEPFADKMFTEYSLSSVKWPLFCQVNAITRFR